MPLFNFNRRKKENPVDEIFSDFDKALDEFNQETEQKIAELRKQNEAWEHDFKILTGYRSTAVELEKESKWPEAIEQHLNAIKYGESNAKFKLNNFVEDIQRVIILYGKTKEKAKLQSFLQNLINKYPETRYTADWKRRSSIS